ncbi:hypothetical protein [Pseudonocardia sp. HH130629-09]|uniref:hypothetical protein n=1 Tax=Pseudonocardia sp. HH130629-09 TaxID=1641402 RepID=UPI0006CB7E22|nr:hypothetical protein [Pseudonocardia sp. HH130629-09]ALE84158.1 hypothetical protein XF36_14290 [Pseudonocardia sp. HH130629-09]
MNVSLWVWLITIVGFVLVIGADLWLNDHKPHAVTLGEVTRWVVFYVALAVAFGGTVSRSVFSARHAGLRSGEMGTDSDDIGPCGSKRG